MRVLCCGRLDQVNRNPVGIGDGRVISYVLYAEKIETFWNDRPAADAV